MRNPFKREKVSLEDLTPYELMKHNNRLVKIYRLERDLLQMGTLLIGIIVGLAVLAFIESGYDDLDRAGAVTESIVQEATPETQEPIGQNSISPVTPTKPEEKHPAPTATWHHSTREHNPCVDLLLSYEEGYIYNFNNLVATGWCSSSKMWKDVETEYGIILSVIDSDSVNVHPYNYSNEHLTVKSVTADRSAGDYANTQTASDYTIDGYSACENGVGMITVTFSNGNTTKAIVFKQGNELFAANFVRTSGLASLRIDQRQNALNVMAENGITMEHALYTDNINYPIVIVDPGEASDVDYWINLSNEIVEDDWTDMRKVLTFYDYCLDNLAYDQWIVNQGEHSRWHYYADFTGKQYTSNTKVGVCHDFANIIAIMCRAHNIPAFVASNVKHAWDVVYICDYSRWISLDSSADMLHYVNTEDTNVLKDHTYNRYRSLDNVAYTIKELYIGNYTDMQRNGILYPWE